jgi:hypothetical protein
MTITTNYVCMDVFPDDSRNKLSFSTIEKCLESLEIIPKSPEIVTSVSVYTSFICQHAIISLIVGDKSQKGRHNICIV